MDQLTGGVFRAGRFTVRLQTSLTALTDAVAEMYAEAEQETAEFADFTVRVAPASGLRRWYRPQAVFSMNGARPFAPLPLRHAYPLLEWGLNWCVSQHCNEYLIIHAAVLEKAGRALVLPGTPGAGKSTLAALLSGLGGWRLLSDELTLVGLDKPEIHPNPRPISLKNQSIEILRRELPHAVLSTPVNDTLKGTVAQLRLKPTCVAAYARPALPGFVVFPSYSPSAEVELIRVPRGEAFLRMADNAFNYSILGEVGFRALARLLDHSDCFEYPNRGDVDRALRDMDSLLDA